MDRTVSNSNHVLDVSRLSDGRTVTNSSRSVTKSSAPEKHVLRNINQRDFQGTLADALTSSSMASTQSDAVSLAVDEALKFANEKFDFSIPSSTKDSIKDVLNQFFDWLRKTFVSKVLKREAVPFDPRWALNRNAGGINVEVRGRLPQGAELDTVLQSFGEAIPFLPPGSQLHYEWKEGKLSFFL